jgi:predicted MFS family arabinose efflux permease
MESSFRTAAHNGVWVSAILFVYVEQNLHATEEWWGYINGSFSAGMIVGGLLAYRFSERIGARLPGTIFLGTLLCGVLTLVFGFVQAPLLALVIALIRGIPEQLRDVAETLVFQKSASDKLLAKIYAAHGVLFYIVYGVSVLLLGWITDAFGLTSTFLFASACLGIAAVLAFASRKQIKDLGDPGS